MNPPFNTTTVLDNLVEQLAARRHAAHQRRLAYQRLARAIAAAPATRRRPQPRPMAVAA